MKVPPRKPYHCVPADAEWALIRPQLQPHPSWGLRLDQVADTTASANIIQACETLPNRDSRTTYPVGQSVDRNEKSACFLHSTAHQRVANPLPS
jgi:hypothetical protein